MESSRRYTAARYVHIFCVMEETKSLPAQQRLDVQAPNHVMTQARTRPGAEQSAASLETEPRLVPA